jgi:hypothetical protein
LIHWKIRQVHKFRITNYRSPDVRIWSLNREMSMGSLIE